MSKCDDPKAVKVKLCKFERKLVIETIVIDDTLRQFIEYGCRWLVKERLTAKTDSFFSGAFESATMPSELSFKEGLKVYEFMDNEIRDHAFEDGIRMLKYLWLKVNDLESETARANINAPFYEYFVKRDGEDLAYVEV